MTNKLALLAAILFSWTVSFAAVIMVPTDQPTFQAGIDNAVNGDTIIVSPGVYTGNGNRDIDFQGKAVVLISASGPENTVIQCEGSLSEPHRAFYFHSGEDTTSVVSGFSIQGGLAWVQSGGGILAKDSSSPLIVNCKFSNNSAYGFVEDIFPRAGGAVGSERSNIQYQNCVFDNNSAGGGGAVDIYYGSPKFFNCLFINNLGLSINGFTTNSSGHGGAIASFFASPIFVNCIFSGNIAKHYHNEPGQSQKARGGAISFFGLSSQVTYGQVINCTFFENVAEATPTENGLGGAIYCFRASPTITNCVVANSKESEAIYCADTASHPIVMCSNIFGNEGGDWVGCIASQAGINGNFSANPYLCNADSGNLYLRASSPCAPNNNSCSQLIGALPVDSACLDCCFDPTGNIDCDGGQTADISDLTVFIDHLFITLTPLCCPDAANTDGTGTTDISDLTALIDYLFISLAPTAPCQ